MPREDNGVDGPFLCHLRYSQLEKISILKMNLKHLIGDVERKIKRTAVILNITINPTGKANTTHNILVKLFTELIIIDVQEGSSVDGTPSKKKNLSAGGITKEKEEARATFHTCASSPL